MKSSMLAAAAIGTAIPPRTDMHLVMQRLPTGEPSQVIVRSTPFGAPNPVDFGALVIFSMLSWHTDLTKRVANKDETTEIISGLPWKNGAFRNTRMNYDVWTEILSWLLDGNVFRLSSSMTAPQFPNFQDRLEQLAIPLRSVVSRVCIPSSHLFAQNYQRSFEIAYLLDATLNADQAVVERLFEGKDDIAIKAMLSISRSAVIEHLGIERTGTPLQMALYSHDEAMFKLLADQMDPAEVQSQCKVVFGHYKVANYDELIKKLDADAKTLCGELEAAFAQARAIDIANALNRFPGTASALQDVLNRFNINLDQYVRDNPVHNPYILQRLFEIYDHLPYPYDLNRECLLSQQAIGSAQKLSSAQWLQHYAQGIYCLGKESDAEAARRAFSCCGSFPALDIRSSEVLPCLGAGSCIDIFGGPGRAHCVMLSSCVTSRRGPWVAMWSVGTCIKTFVEKKQRVWEKLMRPTSRAERRCVVQ